MPVELFKEKQFGLAGLKNITEEQISEHLKLYAGYVKNTNTLREKIAEMVKGGSAGSPEYGELVRRLGFEYNGMRLHELYFDNMSGKGGNPDAAPKLKKALESAFDGWNHFETHFTKVAAMRGVGWTILYQDKISGNLSVHWINLHEDGNPAGFNPLLVMDVWEHAFTVYLKPTQRAKYIEDFWANIAWEVVQGRLE